MKKAALILFILTAFIACKKTETKPFIADESQRGLVVDNAMVVSARVEASIIGTNILRQGGNAFDAMVATELALAVSYPYAGNIGGGGFMVYRMNNGDIGSLDYREKAPLAASKDMYLDDDSNVIPGMSTKGAMAVGIPGTIAGVFASHKKFGSLPIETILSPVIELAERGVVITKKQEERIKKFQSVFTEVNPNGTVFDGVWKENDTLKYPALAKTLKAIMNNGRDEFYKGETAKTFVKFMQDNGGIIIEEDLSKYEAQWRTPVTFEYDNLKVISMSPPSSGGVCLAQIMKMIEPFDVGQYSHNSQKAVQIIVEAERRSYADRSLYLGDPDFVNIPTDSLLSKKYLMNRMNSFSFKKASKSSDILPGSIVWDESEETTHYSIVDQMGNAVAVTTTLNGSYGSKVFVEEGGYFLNNEMDDFSSKPGVPNMFGLLGGKANAIEPQKRMLSAMTPTIVERNGKLAMILGTPGGSTIITSVLQTLLNVYEFKMDIQKAVTAPRFHHQWLPDEIVFEPNSFNTSLIENLKAKDYKITQEYSRIIGRVDAILISESNQISTGADPRGDDTAVHLY